VTIPISRPYLGREEREAVLEVLDSGVLAQGPRVAKFEGEFADYVGTRHAIATSNGTTALHTALLAHGIGPGDEIITSPFTFVASINSILFTGATPRLVDCGEDFNLDPVQARRAVTLHTRAIMPVHLYGQPCDMDELESLAAEQGLILVEDACQAHGAEFRGRRAGSFGTGCFSFYATKNMTTGEGGMITTNDDAVAARARRIINHGMQRRYYHEESGYNFRLTEVAAAIGSEQLKKLDTFNARRRETAAYYDRELSGLAGLELPQVLVGRTHVYHQYTVRVGPEFPLSRDGLSAALAERGIATGVYYPLAAHRQEAYRGSAWAQVGCPRADEYAAQVISLPVHPLVTDAEREHIVATVRALAAVTGAERKSGRSNSPRKTSHTAPSRGSEDGYRST
jgi:dTDP-4-amino-4,6-dideoxygalactose transaminase